ncbi:hypothetical protein AX17_002666 [Amanita inopinata Kibby_2008]|nr:hypothetical protein AX17_002666 [Amanita inopinata Kibby_2008]
MSTDVRDADVTRFVVMELDPVRPVFGKVTSAPNAHARRVPKLVQQIPDPGQHVPGTNQSIYPMTGLVQEFYMPTHQPLLVRHPEFSVDQKGNYMPAIDPSIGSSSIPE